jgi:hypothetical protein
MVGYFILAIYFDAVIPNVYGKRKNPFFFLWPFRGSPFTGKPAKANSSFKEDSEDIDLILERQNAHDWAKEYAIRILDLTKMYLGNKTAIKNLCLTLEEGKL